MLTLPADVARCRGREWYEGEILAPECQTCERWVAHHCWQPEDGPVNQINPPTDRVCPMRLKIESEASA